MKFRLSLLMLLGCYAIGSPNCDAELAAKWNTFANDANKYVSTVSIAGRADAKRAKQRERLQKEWEAVTNCECW